MKTLPALTYYREFHVDIQLIEPAEFNGHVHGNAVKSRLVTNADLVTTVLSSRPKR